MRFFLVQKVIVLSLLVMVVNSRVFAETAKPIKNLETKILMNKFLNHMEALKEYFVSEEKFSDPKNSKEISSHLKSLSELSEKAAHDFVLKQENYKLSRMVLASHIAETEQVFREGKKSYARWMLGSTMNICMSCHAQLPAVSRELKDFREARNFANDFSQAEFFYATRAFEKASEIYKKIILNYPVQNNKVDQLETALEREAAYYSRIKRNPVMAIGAFQSYSKNEKLPQFLKDHISSWIIQFKNWDKNPNLDPRTATDSQILKYIKENLESKKLPLLIQPNDPMLVNYLKVSGILYEFLQSHPKSPVVPQILYWLAICDKSINTNFFFSMSDIYLKECILSHPADPIAKKCFKEYEDETILSYSGSGGTNIPDSVTEELNRLRELIKNGGKIKLNGN